MLNDITLSADGLSPSWRLTDETGATLTGYGWSTAGISGVGGGSLKYRVKYTPPYGVLRWGLEGRDNIGGAVSSTTITLPGSPMMLNDIALSADGLLPSWRLTDGLGVSLTGYDWSTVGIYPVGGGSLQYRVIYAPPPGITKWGIEGRDNLGGAVASAIISLPGLVSMLTDITLSADGFAPSWRLTDELGVSLIGYDWSTVGISGLGGGTSQYRVIYNSPIGMSQWGIEGRDNLGGPISSTTVMVSSAILSSASHQVNTAVPPAGPGQYNPDGLWPGMYCTAADVFANSLGLDWKAVHAKLCEYGSVQYGDVTSITDLINLHFIPDAEADADSRMRQTLKPTQRTQFFSGSGRNSMLLPYVPVLSVDAARIYVIPSVVFYQFQRPRLTHLLGAVDPSATYADADLLVDPDTGKIVIPAHVLYGDTFQVPLWNYNFLSGDWNIMVTWTSGINGSANVPRALRIATALLVTIQGYEILGSIQRQGLAVSKTGSSQFGVGREKNLPYSDLIARLEAKVKRLLLPLQNAS